MIEDDLFEERSATNGNGEIFTRYSREERLKNAPLEVQQLHDASFIPRKGIIRSLTATKGLRAVFFSIIVLAALTLILFALQKDKNTGYLYDIKLELTSFVFEGTPLANLRMNANNDFAEKLKAKKNSKNKERSSSDETSDEASDDNIDLVGDVVKVQFSFFDGDGRKLFHTIKTGIYNGSDLSFSARDETKKAKVVEANILMREKLLKLTKRIND